MITANIHDVKGFERRLYADDPHLPTFGTVRVISLSGEASVFYGSVDQIEAHISELQALAREMDEHKKTEGVE